jgi:hypothetical protein
MEFLTCGYKISLILSKKWNNASLLTFQERFALKLASVFLGKLTNIQCQCRSLSVKCRKQCKAPTNSMRKLTMKKKSEIFNQFLTLKNDFESQNF